MRSNKNIAKHLLSLVLSFLLALVSIITILTLTINITISQPTYMKSKITSSKFALKASAELEELFASYGAASGFEISVFAPLLDENKIVSDINLTVDNIYLGTGAVKFEDVKSLIFTSLIENANSRGIVLTEEIQNGIDELAKMCAYEYTDKVSIPYFDHIASTITKVNNYINTFKFGLWLVILIAAGCILYVNKFSHRCFRYFAYACTSSFIVLAIIPCVVFIQDKIAYLSIRPISLNHFFVEYTNGVFMIMLFMSLGALILAVLCIASYYAFRSKILKRKI